MRYRAIRRTVAHASLSYFTGSHDLKAGFQWDNGRYFAENFSTSGMRAVYRDGVPDSVNTYNTPVSRTSYVQDTALFVQDKWSASRKLTLNIGVRLEKFSGWQPETCQVETQFVAGQCFAALEDVPGLAGPVAAIRRDLRHLRRRPDGHQGGSGPLQHRDGDRTHRSGQPGEHHERHASVERREQRPHSAAGRARCVDGLQLRDDEPLRRRSEAAVCHGVLRGVRSADCERHCRGGRVLLPDERTADRQPEPARADRKATRR